MSLTDASKPVSKGPNFLLKEDWDKFIIRFRTTLSLRGNFTDGELDEIVELVTKSRSVADDGSGHYDLGIMLQEVTPFIEDLRRKHTEENTVTH